MNTIKKIICMCTVLTMASSFASCNTKEVTKSLSSDKSAVSDTEKKDNKNLNAHKITEYYDEIPMELFEDFQYISSFKYSDNKLYLLGGKYPEENYSLMSTDLNTLETTEIPDNNESQGSFDDEKTFTDNQGNIYKCGFGGVEKYDKNKKLIKKIDEDFFKDQGDVSTLFFYSSTVSENGDIYIAASLKTPETIQIIKLNNSCEIQYITEKGNFSDCGNYIKNIFIGKDENPVLCTESDMSYINVLSPDSGQTVLRYELPILEQVLGCYGDNDLIYRNGNTIYSYDYINDNSIEMFTADSDMYEITDACLKDGAIITRQLKKEDSENILSIVSTDGKSEKSISIPGDHKVVDMNVTSDGTVYFLTNDHAVEYNDDGCFETTKPGILRVKDDGTIETVYSGEKQYSEIHYIFATDSKGNICLSGYDSFDSDNNAYITYISSTGEQTEISLESQGYINSIVCLNDEFNITFSSYESYGSECLIVDKENKTINKTDNSFDLSRNILNGNNGYDYYYSSGSNILGYHISDGSSEKIFSWLNTDVMYVPDLNTDVAIADPGNIFYIASQDNYYNNVTESESQSAPVLIHLKKADEARLEELNSRYIITVAGMDLDYSYFSKIKQFNKNNNDYMIIATDYSEYDPESGNDNSVVLSKLEKDIVQGIIPDVILGDQWSFDIQSFISNDTLADLNNMIKNDPQTGSDLAENILDACSDNGKLYSIPLNMNLETITVPQECIDNNKLLTYDEFFNLWDNSGDRLPLSCTREEGLDLLISSYVNENVDLKNAACSFETDMFKKILEKSKQLISEEIYYKEQYDNPEKHEYLFDKIVIHSSNDLFSYLNGPDYNSFNISNAVIGIPSSSNVASILNIDSYMCITNSSENKEGAWEFIKYLITDDDDSYMGSSTDLSIFHSRNQNAIDQMLSEMTDDPETYSKDNIEKYQAGLETLFNGKMICNNRFKKIHDIIFKEADNYYNDTQSLDQTVSAIQSKVKLYLSEVK